MAAIVEDGDAIRVKGLGERARREVVGRDQIPAVKEIGETVAPADGFWSAFDRRPDVVPLLREAQLFIGVDAVVGKGDVDDRLQRSRHGLLSRAIGISEAGGTAQFCPEKNRVQRAWHGRRQNRRGCVWREL